MKKSILLGALGSILLITLFVAQAAAQVSLSGNVQGRGGDPKGFASIQLTGPETYNSITDPRGNFNLSNVRPGRYLVTVEDRNRVQKFTVTIGSGTTRLPLVLGW